MDTRDMEIAKRFLAYTKNMSNAEVVAGATRAIWGRQPAREWLIEMNLIEK